MKFVQKPPRLRRGSRDNVQKFQRAARATTSPVEELQLRILCEGVGGVQGALTLFCGRVAQTCHDDRVVELRVQLVVEEVDGERQEGKVKEEGRGRVKENAPWMTLR